MVEEDANSGIGDDEGERAQADANGHGDLHGSAPETSAHADGVSGNPEGDTGTAIFDGTGGIRDNVIGVFAGVETLTGIPGHVLAAGGVIAGFKATKSADESAKKIDISSAEKRLRELVAQKGFEFVEMTELEERAQRKFSEKKWRDSRKEKIKEVIKILGGVSDKVFDSLAMMEVILGPPYTGSGDAQGLYKKNFSIDEMIKLARKELESIGSENQELKIKLLIKKELNQVRAVINKIASKRKGSKIIGKEDAIARLRESLIRSCNELLATLRYCLEASEGTYRAGRITPEFLATMLGFELSELFFRDDNSRKKIVDFGCGDGDLLIGLAEVRRTIEAIPGLQMMVVANNKDPAILKSFHTTIEKIFKEGYLFHPKDAGIDPNIIGLDQAKPFIDRLKSSDHGVNGFQVDICCPFPKLSQKTHTGKGSVDIAITSNTLDRAKDTDQLIENMATPLRPNGKFVIVTKQAIDPNSDGASAKGNSIQYRRKGQLESKDAVDTIEKLIPLLAKQGLIIERVALHPYRVISIDSLPDGPGSRPQQMEVLIITGRKDPNFKPVAKSKK